MRILTVLMLAAALFAQPATAQQYNAPLAESEGEIFSLNFANSTMNVGGYEFQVASTVKVEIDGTYGAFTMLRKGMLIEFSYYQFDDGVRRIVEIYEVDEVEEY